jgi:MFS transporter, MHS family, proline/betaine transporter
MTSETMEYVITDAPLASSRKAVMAALIGNLLEWYDFAVYGFLALTIAKLFFPSGDETASLLASVAAFGVGFLMRPVGALVLGTLADRKGRKPALTAIIVLMAIGTAMIGFAPTYHQAGIWGPTIIVLGRLIQGFSAGGEFGSAAAYLVEQVPAGRRGFYSSWWQATVSGALLLGSAVTAGITGLLTEDELLSWGWRIPFLLGLLIGPVGFYIRTRAPETLAPQPSETGPLRTAFAAHWDVVATGFGLVIVNTVCTYFFLVNMPTFAVRQLHVVQHDALLANAAALVVSATSALLAGKLADRAGAFRPMVIAVLFTGACVYPALAWLLTHPDLTALIAFQIVFGIPLGAMLGLLPAFMASLFPARTRSTGLSIAYNGANSLFGGFTPFIVTWLIALTGDVLAPAFYVAGAAAVSLVALALAPRRSAPNGN